MTQAPEYRLVPVEPTEAMLSAIDMTHACEPIDQWRAAIAASPLPAAPAADRAELAAEAQRKLSRACGVWSNLMAYEGFTDAKADAAKAAENEARAAIDALARSTDAPSELAADERELFEAAFPKPAAVSWDGQAYTVREDSLNSYACERFVARWDAWQVARAALTPKATQPTSERGELPDLGINGSRCGTHGTSGS